MVFPVTPRPQDLYNELTNFIKAISVTNQQSPDTDLTRTALRLLRTIPSARTAIFQYLSDVFSQITSNYVSQNNDTDYNDILSEIYVVLTNFISANPNGWAPIISQWSLELLGEISTKFTKLPFDLNELLNYWLNCRATKILVDINTKCMLNLVNSNTETCINALLETSIKHSPHFDWVVAYIGQCFPQTVINRVLSLGLKDFTQQIKSSEQALNSLKLKSVIGILEHLATNHRNDINVTVKSLFLWCLSNDNCQNFDIYQKKMTIPYLLQLSQLSDIFLNAITINLNENLTIDLINLINLDDLYRYFGTIENFELILIELLLNCTNSFELIQLLINYLNNFNNNERILYFLQIFLMKINEFLRTNKQIPFLNSLINLNDLFQLLLETNELNQKILIKLIIYLSYNNLDILKKSLKFLFLNSHKANELNLLIKLLTNERIDRNSFASVLNEIFAKKYMQPTIVWCNFLYLLNVEQAGNLKLLNSIQFAIEFNIKNLIYYFLNDLNNIHLISQLFENIQINNLNIELLLNLTQAIINYFFYCCMDTNNNNLNKLRGFERISKIMRKICLNKFIKIYVIRELIERCLFGKENILFGGKTFLLWETNDRLLIEKNLRHSKILTKHRFSGHIAHKRHLLCVSNVSDDVIQLNKVKLIDVLKVCCWLHLENSFDMDLMTQISLLLVQFISPDIMYNGLPWPDEEFTKVTIERDLFISRLFGNVPLMWDLLEFIACYRPTLCYCSVLMRALTATVIHQWKSISDETMAKQNNCLMLVTMRIIDLLGVGQLLPPPLNCVRDILPFLKSYEIVAILKDCVWAYIRDHIPSPALFYTDSNGVFWRDPTVSRPLECYTNTLKIIMQRNIDSLGCFYGQMFINIPKHE